MMRWIIGSCLQFRLLVVVIAGVMLFVGISHLRETPVDILPEFSRPYVEVQTESLGLSAEEVEQLITVPMEQDLLNGVPWLEEIRSESLSGLSSIVLVFEYGADLGRARQLVAERLAQAVALPHVSTPPIMLQPLSSTSRVMMIGLSSKDVSLIEMSVLARWTIAPRLMAVQGVANVAIWGQRDRELQVQVDPKRLNEKDVSLLRVLETTGNALWVSSLTFVEASTPGTGGFIDTANQRLGIRHILPIVTAKDLAQVPIEDTTVRLGDVADVVEDHQPLIGDALTKDGTGVLLVIEKFPGANTLDVTRGVEDALAELGPGLPGIDVNPHVFRTADFIDTSMSNMSAAVLTGLALVALILAVFFVEWRAVLISLIAVSLSLVVAGLVLRATGATFNMIVLTGLAMAIGILAYDAIADVENIARRLRQHREEGSSKSTARIILQSSLEARGTILWGVLILLLTVSPVFFIEGLSGAFFRPLAVSYGLAVLASMVVALTVTPALCLMLLSNAPIARRQSRPASWLQHVYEPMLGWFVRRGRMAYVAVVVLTAVGVAVLPSLSRSVLPPFQERQLLIHLKAMPGTSQPETSRISGRVAEELRTIKGVHDVGVHIGRAILGDQVVNVNSAELWVNIDSSANYDETATAIQTAVEGYPGLNFDVQSYLKEKSSDVLAEPQDEVIVRVYGDTDEGLRSTAEDVRKAIAGISGVETQIRYPVQQATLEAEVDLAAAQRHGLKPGDVRRAAATLVSGIRVGSLFEEQKVFNVVVWSTPETRHSLSSISDLRIDTPSGEHVRLGDVAKVRIVPTASVIRHDSVKRYIDVAADVRGRELSEVAAEIKERLANVTFPLEYFAKVQEDYAFPKAARARLVAASIAAAIGVFFVLQAAFTSWRLAALTLFILPSALVGGLLAALFAADGVISLGSLAGFLVLFGITVYGSIALIKHYQHLTAKSQSQLSGVEPEVVEFRAQFDARDHGDPMTQQDGEPHHVSGLVMRGARERFLPIVMTTLAIALALVPNLFFGNISGLEVLRPMSIVVLGGLVSSTFLILFCLPAMYSRFKPVRGPDLADLSIALIDEEDMREAMFHAHGRDRSIETTSISD